MGSNVNAASLLATEQLVSSGENMFISAKSSRMVNLLFIMISQTTLTVELMSLLDQIQSE